MPRVASGDLLGSFLEALLIPLGSVAGPRVPGCSADVAEMSFARATAHVSV